MANKDAPFGFRPEGELGSNIQNGGTTRYQIADNQANAIYKGDLVFIGDGTVTDQVGTAVAKGYIGASAASNVMSIGVFNGCFVTKHPTTGKPYWSNYYPDMINLKKLDTFLSPCGGGGLLAGTSTAITNLLLPVPCFLSWVSTETVISESTVSSNAVLQECNPVEDTLLR